MRVSRRSSQKSRASKAARASDAKRGTSGQRRASQPQRGTQRVSRPDANVRTQRVPSSQMNPKPRRRRKISKAERLQYLLELNQKDGRRSGVVRPLNWFMFMVAVGTFMCSGFIVVQAMMVPGASWDTVIMAVALSVVVGLCAGWISVLTAALRRSSAQAKESYFATLRREPTKGNKIKDGFIMRNWRKFLQNTVSQR